MKLFHLIVKTRHGAEQYAGDLECVFYGYHLDRAILKIAEAAYSLMPSLVKTKSLPLPGHAYCRLPT